MGLWRKGYSRLRRLHELRLGVATWIVRSSPGAVGGENEIREFDHLECDPLYLAFRPCHPLLGSKDAPLKIVKRNAIVDGIPCLELTRRVGESIQSCWVDPSRDDLVVQSERRHPRLGLWRVTITHRFSPQVGWIPDRWTLHRPWSDDDKVLCEATTCILNERLPADVFRIDFPPGTLVFDLKTRKQSVIAADGSQIGAPSFESVSSPAFRKALDAVEPFTIAPEPIQTRSISFANITNYRSTGTARPSAGPACGLKPSVNATLRG